MKRLFVLYLVTWSYSYELVFVVLGYNRPNELGKTLVNLCTIKSDRTYTMTIHIDGPTSGNEDLVNESINVAKRFNCPIYNTTVINHSRNRGILGQWMEAWAPKDSQYALIIEDDVELSPDALYLVDILVTRFKDDPDLYGIALQRAQWQLGICERRRWRRLDIVGEDEYPPFFKYPALGTWGQLLFPKPWSEFLAESDMKDSSTVSIDGLVTEEWGRRGRRLISPVFTRWALRAGYLNLYTNFGPGRAMAASRQPPDLDEIKEKLKHADKLRIKSPCFDPVDLSIDEHIRQYGMVVSIPRDTDDSGKKGVECSLAVHRIYPAGSSDIVPRLEIHSKQGYFKPSPFEIMKHSDPHSNVDYIFNDTLVMRLVRNRGPAVLHILRKDQFEMGPTVNRDGVCCKFYCPFTAGLYPDRPKPRDDGVDLKIFDL